MMLPIQRSVSKIITQKERPNMWSLSFWRPLNEKQNISEKRRAQHGQISILNISFEGFVIECEKRLYEAYIALQRHISKTVR